MTSLSRIQQNVVLVKMDVFFHLKADCSEILCAGFQTQRIRFCCQIFDLWFGSKVIFMQTLMLILPAETGIAWELLTVSKFWQQK